MNIKNYKNKVSVIIINNNIDNKSNNKIKVMIIKSPEPSLLPMPPKEWLN